MARRQPAPTPPYTDRDIEYMARTRTGINSPQPSSLTPALSPSHQPSTASSPLRRLSDDFSFTAQPPPYAPDVSYFHPTVYFPPHMHVTILFFSASLSVW
jgi:hypothetical protein